ncbi:MAG: hypothetical protein E6713_03730 [Sporomusaceae bacterium]|nr:hypothetical protein [Sporomusaceae bacterium]
MAEELAIETKCLSCDGTGWQNGQECPHCKGSGTILTEEGKALIYYLKECIRMSEH